MLNGRISKIDRLADRVVFSIDCGESIHRINLYPTDLALAAQEYDHVWTQGHCAYLTARRPLLNVHDARLWMIRQDAGEAKPWTLEEAITGRVLTSTGRDTK